MEEIQIPTESTVREPHRPSRRGAVVFFILTIAIALGLAVWELFLNRGTLVIAGAVPFSASVGGKSIICEASPCSIQLKPKEYTVNFKREGYFDLQEKVTVKRFSDVTIEPRFFLIPGLIPYTAQKIPQSFPLSSIATAPAELPNFPKDATAATLNPTGLKIIVKRPKELLAYDAVLGTTTQLPIPLDAAVAWAGDAIVYVSGDASGIQTLSSFAGGKTTPLVQFERTLVKPTIVTNDSGSKVLVSESTEAGTQHYLIDVKTLSRKRLNLANNALFESFADPFIIFKEKPTPSETQFVAQPFDGTEKIILPKAAQGVAAMSGNRTLIYITGEKSDVEGDASQLSIEDALKQISELGKDITPSVDDLTKDNADFSLFVTALDLGTGETKTILTLPLKEGQRVTDIARVAGKLLLRIDATVYQMTGVE